MKLLPWAVALAFACAPAANAQIAVIVNPKLAISELSFDDVRRIFAGKTAQLANTALVVGLEAGTGEKFCSTVLGISAAAIHKRWVLLAFQGEVSSVLRDLPDADAARKFVASTPGGIAFIPASEVNATVKVLRIDGALPSDPAYKVK
jgi:ABC-type phosphate transport system substrate-binding protein